jgi:hypothetical protein
LLIGGAVALFLALTAFGYWGLVRPKLLWHEMHSRVDRDENNNVHVTTFYRAGDEEILHGCLVLKRNERGPTNASFYSHGNGAAACFISFWDNDLPQTVVIDHGGWTRTLITFDYEGSLVSNVVFVGQWPCEGVFHSWAIGINHVKASEIRRYASYRCVSVEEVDLYRTLKTDKIR